MPASSAPPPASDHRRTLDLFLRTDQHRLAAALEGAAWSPRVAARLRDHLHYMAQVRAVYLQGLPPNEPRQPAEDAAPHCPDAAAALAQIEAHYEALRAAIAQVSEARLHAPVLDPHERGLSVLGHLYDLCRASAMLVEWAAHLPRLAAHDAALRQRWGEAEP